MFNYITEVVNKCIKTQGPKTGPCGIIIIIIL